GADDSVMARHRSSHFVFVVDISLLSMKLWMRIQFRRARMMAVTSLPRFNASFKMADPTKPVAPINAIFMVHLLSDRYSLDLAARKNAYRSPFRCSDRYRYIPSTFSGNQSA